MEKELNAVTERIRGDFPVLARTIDGSPIIYLDSAATSLKPKAVIDAITHYYAGVGANIHRGKHYLSEEASARYERSRHQVSQYLGARSNEIVFTPSTTAGLNMVAHGLGLCRDDLVMVAMDAHHSNLLPWRKLCRTSTVRVRSDGHLDLGHYHELLKERPRVVAINHCSNVTGLYMPLAELASAARAQGAIVVVDAAQSLPHRRLKVTELDVDFLAFSSHKMLGPTGLGVLYGRQELLEKLEPVFIGGGAVDWVDSERYDLRKIPHRFEAGTPHIAGVYGIAAAIEYLERLGTGFIEAHDLSLGQTLLREAKKRPYLRVLGGESDGERAALVSLELKGCKDLGDVARMLSDSYGVMCRSGHLCAQPLVDALCDGEVLRISAYIYNTEAEVLRAFEALDEIHESLGL